MLIVSTGMMRSGSTWQYQVACDLACLLGPAEFLGYRELDDFAKEYDRISSAKGVIVVKMHPPHELVAELARQGQARILYSFRDIRDVVYSSAHKLMLQPRQVLEWYLPAILEGHRFWMNCTNRFAMRYEDFLASSVVALSQLAEFLDVSIMPEKIAEIDRRYSLDANRERASEKKRKLEQDGCDLSDSKYTCLHDHEELVHWNHLRTGEKKKWWQLATAEELAQLGDACGDWLIENGYETNRNWVGRAIEEDNWHPPSNSRAFGERNVATKFSIGMVRSWGDNSKSENTNSSGPLFSVIVPTCGRVPLFIETLNSLATQTYRNLQLVVTDDSSREQDRSAIRRAVETFALSSGNEAHYVYSASGLQQAGNTNQGIVAAHGELLRILHSDDLLRHDALEHEAAIFQSHPQVDLLFEDCIPFTREVVWDRDPQAALIHPAHHLRNELSHSTALPSGLAFRRQVIERTGLMDERLRFLCDWELFFRLLVDQIRQGKLVCRFTAGLFGWRTHDDSVTKRMWKVHFEEHEQFIEDVVTNAELDALGAFSADEKQHFSNCAFRYRYNRLWDDFRQLSWPDKWQARKWIFGKFRGPGKKLLRKHLTRSIERSFSRVLRGPKTPKRPKPSDPCLVEANRRTYRTLAENIGTLAIMPVYDGAIVATHPKSIQVDYDNGIHLWPYREEIARARSVRLFFVNYNRMYPRVLHEVLKYIRVGQEVEVLLGGNVHLQWFGLKAVVDQLFPGQFTLTNQNNIVGDFYSITCQRREYPPPHLCVEHTGWTFGLLTLGDNAGSVERYVRSIAEAQPNNYEILIVSPRELNCLNGAQNVRQIIFSDRDDLGWITRKKNLICQAASYTDILICHDRFQLTPTFCRDWNAWGYSYGIAAPRVQLHDGHRGLDWAVASSQNHTWSHGGLLDYRSYSPYVYVPGGATAVRKPFWERFHWNENLYWNEHEDVELCRRAQRSGEIVSLASATLIAASDRWIDQNPLLPFNTDVESLFGGPVGEQRIDFRPLPMSEAA
jgi:GT2 family glycosyltransferase